MRQHQILIGIDTLKETGTCSFGQHELILCFQAKLPCKAAQHRHATDVLCQGDFTVWWHIKHCGFGHACASLSHAADG